MGSRKPRLGIEIRTGRPEDPLRFYVGCYRLTACCRRPWCEHQRDLHIELLLRIFGGDTQLGGIANRLRCHRCGMRGARIQACYIGPLEDR